MCGVEGFAPTLRGGGNVTSRREGMSLAQRGVRRRRTERWGNAPRPARSRRAGTNVVQLRESRRIQAIRRIEPSFRMWAGRFRSAPPGRRRLFWPRSQRCVRRRRTERWENAPNTVPPRRAGASASDYCAGIRPIIETPKQTGRIGLAQTNLVPPLRGGGACFGCFPSVTLRSTLG